MPSSLTDSVVFTILKIIGSLILPTALLAVGLVTGLVLLVRRRHRASRIVLIAATVLYLLLATEPVSALLAWTLEHRYRDPVVATDHPDAVAIVVLGSGAAKAGGYRPIPELSGTSWLRLWRAVELHRSLAGAIPIFYVGGSGDPFDPVSGEAALAQSYSETFGIPSDAFVIETTSRNTYENARALQQLLSERSIDGPVFLVTSAAHLPRATAVFDRLRIATIPVASDYRGGALRLDLLSFIPAIEPLETSTLVTRELFAILLYGVLGRR